MIFDIEFGLFLVGDNPNLTFILFIAFSLLGALGMRFGYYAHRNDQAAEMEMQGAMWRTMTIIGAVAFVYSLLGIIEIASSLRTPYRRGLWLAAAYLLALVIQVLSRDTVSSASDGDGTTAPGRVFWLSGIAAVVLVSAGTFLDPRNELLLMIEGTSALAFAGVGFFVGRQGISATRVQGTVVDTLLRHLLPVLLFTALVPIAELAVVAGLAQIIILHIQVIFIIMTATALMTATIKLRQNVATF
jgi:hypothetical protein